MKKHEKHFSIWLIDGLARFVFWFIASVSAIFVVFLVVLLLGLTPDELNLSVELPTNFKVLEVGTFTYGDEVSSITISDATGKITFDQAPRFIMVMLALYVLPLLVALLYMLFLFKGFTKNVKLGNVFEPDNIKRLKRLAYIIVGVWLYQMITVTIYNLFIVQKFVFSGVKFYYKTGSVGGLLIIALFVWVLAHIFQKGVEIEEENRLTV